MFTKFVVIVKLKKRLKPKLRHMLKIFYLLADCPLLPSSIPNGFVNGSGSVEGSRYQFRCKEGYSLVGKDTLHCDDKGTWNGAVPSCLKGNYGKFSVKIME